MFVPSLALASQKAQFDFVPLLIIAYVAYMVLSSIVKAARQAQAQRDSAVPAPVVGGMSAEQARAALEARLSSLLSAQRRAAQPPAKPPPAAVVAFRPSVVAGKDQQPSFEESPVPGLQLLTEASEGYAGQRAGFDRKALAALTSLPPAAMAIVAGAIIGPCAAHRGTGHEPENW